MEQVNKLDIIFFIGPPGSGKSTQLSLLKSKIGSYNCVNINAGQLLRLEIRKPVSAYADEINSCFRSGRFVPSEITYSLLEQEIYTIMSKQPQTNLVVIDGYPRNIENLEYWNKNMQTKANVKAIFLFECNNLICLNRCLSRETQNKRTDDTTEIISKRIQTFHEALDIIDSFNKVIRINGELSILEINNQIENEIKSL
jgi:UMP-CMP kinase